jgi:hypothetical protein
VLLFLKIPDGPMATLARWTYIAALPFVDDEEDLLQVQEWEKIFRSGPPLSDAVRRLLRDARVRQVKLTLRGLLIHHAPVIRTEVTSHIRSLTRGLLIRHAPALRSRKRREFR